MKNNTGDLVRRLLRGMFTVWATKAAESFVEDFFEACQEENISSEELMKLFENFWNENPLVIHEAILGEIRQRLIEESAEMDELIDENTPPPSFPSDFHILPADKDKDGDDDQSPSSPKSPSK